MPANPVVPATTVSYAAGIVTLSAFVATTAAATTDLNGRSPVVNGRLRTLTGEDELDDSAARRKQLD